MIYVYRCNRCGNIREEQRSIADRNVYPVCCDHVTTRVVGAGIRFVMPRALRDSDHPWRGYDKADLKAAREADEKTYEANWDHKTPSKRTKRDRMAELHKAVKNG